MAYITFQPKDYFNTKLWTGTGSSNALTGVGFQPDWVWIKARGATTDHVLYDAVRGVTKNLHSNTNDADDTQTDGLTAFGTDGFTVGADSKSNANSGTFASWNWKANGSGSANTDGSISSTVSANTTAGFSIVKYTASSSASTIGHGLGVKPKMIMQKNLDASGNWGVYHENIGATKFLALNTTDAEATNSTPWNDTEPTTSVFSIGSGYTNGNEYIAYCFTEKKGFSKFGSYTGNGNANGPFIFCGFKPAFFLWKRHNSTGGWYIADNARSPFNLVDKILGPNDNNQESAFGTVQNMDFLANGIKLRGTNVDSNYDGGQYIFMAFAEEPLVASNNIPATAR